jgi:hypothetical protein
MNTLHFFFRFAGGWVFLFWPMLLAAQTIQGRWQGYVVQNQKPDTLAYEIRIQQDGKAISGSSTISSADGSKQVKFLLSGLIEGDSLILQEVEQLEPDSPPWCRKFARLGFQLIAGKPVLQGHWRASGCTPGLMYLEALDYELKEVDLARARIGKWVGYLSQSDRDYGFYFELLLNEDGSGQSYIVSEGGGGWARHTLRWSWDAQRGIVHIQESTVLERGVPDWPWCIKKSPLRFRKTGDKMQLEGLWSGRIEGTTGPKGRCAEGEIFVERLIPPPRAVFFQAPREKPEETYEKEMGRKVDVQRILDVRSRNIKIRMWDNGVEDRDILTLYLNGKLMVEKHRLSKRKSMLEIDLNEKENILIIHADDLGDLPPNTVALSIDDGYGEQLLLLTSNLKESGAVLIRRFTYQEE